MTVLDFYCTLLTVFSRLNFTEHFKCLNVLILAGGVYLDGHDIKTLDPIWLRNQIGTVSQVCA